MTTSNAAVPSTQSDGGVAVVTVRDIRWARRDIKSTGLLAQVLAKQSAAEAGAYEAWMVDPDGFVTEGASSNAWIVTGEGVLISRPSDHSILKGVTGNSVAGLASMLGIGVERRAFTVAEALAAREAFITSANNFCVAVIAIDGRPVGAGAPGEITARLRRLYLDYARGGEAAIPWTA
jgi:D-alanine transaminase